MVKLIPIMLTCQGPIIKAEERCSLVSARRFREEEGEVLEAHLQKAGIARGGESRQTGLPFCRVSNPAVKGMH